MYSLVDILDRNAVPIFKDYGGRLTNTHPHALSAMRYYRTEQYSELTLRCTVCEHTAEKYSFCGHRSSHRFQHYDNIRRLELQQAKLLPVDYCE